MFKIKKSFRIKSIEKEYKLLYPLNPEVSPFLEYEYMKTALKYIIPYCFIERFYIIFYTIYHNDAPILIAPICRSIFGKKNMLFGYFNGFNYCDLIHNNSDLVNSAFSFLEKKIGKIHITKLKESSTTFNLIPKTFSTKQANVKIIFGNNFNEYFNRLSSSTKQNIRTSYNRLSRDNFEYNLVPLYGGHTSNALSTAKAGGG